MPTFDYTQNVKKLISAREKLTCFITVIYGSGCLMDEEIKDLEDVEIILLDVIDYLTDHLEGMYEDLMKKVRKQYEIC